MGEKARWVMNRTHDNAYVSEFTDFMSRYLGEHPEVVADQRRGWCIFWDRNVDQTAIRAAEKASVPDDHYGYYPTDWCRY